MPDLYEVVDPRPIAAEAPYTFFLPPSALVDSVRPGDHVKAVIRAVPPSDKYDAERMWVHVTAIEGDWLDGELASEPADMPKLARGSAIRRPRWR